MYDRGNEKIRRLWLVEKGGFQQYETELICTAKTSNGSSYPRDAKTSGLTYGGAMRFDPSGRWLYISFYSIVVKMDMDSPDFTTYLLVGKFNTSGSVDGTGDAARLRPVNDMDVNANTSTMALLQNNSYGVRIIN